MFSSVMGKLLDKITAGSPIYAVESTGDGYVLVKRDLYSDDFDRLVRELLDRQTTEFVVLPVTDGSTGYDRAIILPI